jgi:hypothetical protein
MRGSWNGGSYSLQGGFINTTAPDARIDLTGLDVDRQTGRFLLTYRSTVTEIVYYRLLGYNALTLHTGAAFDPPGSDASVSGAVAYDESAGQFVIAYGHDFAAGGAQVELVRYADTAAPAPALGGLACGTGELSWQGSQLIGGNDGVLAMDGVAPGALMTVIVATAPFSYLLNGLPPVVNGCWLLVPNVGPDFIGLLPVTLGPSATWPFPLPGQLDPMTAYFQGVHFDASNSVIYTTQRLAVPLVK